ncbi:MAG: hypothetical protein HUU15_02415 [Candidatus Brocadiae bacterium]|nr:hypothetical protein [Candidatus Brocadiia bacterium]
MTAAAAPAVTALTVRVPFHVVRPSRRIELRPGRAPAPAPDANVPRVARLMALAHHYQRLLDGGEVVDYADLARISGVTRARVSQIMDLSLLAPDIQEEILSLTGFRGREPMTEHDLRPIAATLDWRAQWEAWTVLKVDSLRWTNPNRSPI